MPSKKQLITAAIVLTLLSTIATWKLIGQGYLEKAQESEALASIAAIVTAEEAYHAEYGTYSADFLEIGYSPEGQLRADIYLTQEDLPAEYETILEPDELPMISKDNYRIVAIFKKASKIFIQEKGKPLRVR